MKPKKLSAFSIRFQILFSVLAAISSCYSGRTQAQAISHTPLVSPLQTGHYIPGFINIRDFADPAPASGLLVLDYGAFISSNKFFDRNGDQLTQINGPLNNKVDLNIDMSGYMNVPMVLWASKCKFLGATYFGGVSIPIITVNPNLAYARIGYIDHMHESGQVSGSASGLSDLNLLPIFLSWGQEKFDVTAGWMVYAPTGRYTVGGNDNTGYGFWSNTLSVFGYWYPLDIKGKPSKALAVMLGGTFELIGKIKDADVKPGNRFSLDYGLSQYMSKRLEVGIHGGNNWQVTEDKGNQAFWDKSVKDRLGTLGFQLGYWLWPNRLEAIGKYSFNYGAVQRFEQNTFMLNFIFITNALKGGCKDRKPEEKPE
jgi:hypothetical protein